MDIPDDESRGCIAAFDPMHLTQEQREESIRLKARVDKVNPNVIYRSKLRHKDTTCRVYRWSLQPYEIVFEQGFIAPAKGFPEQWDSSYYSIHDHVFHGGKPLDPKPDPTLRQHCFVSTSGTAKYRPEPQFRGTDVVEATRYEIFVPGGIEVQSTLGKNYEKYKNQKEISFVKGIAPQYIRAAERWTFTRETKKRKSGESTKNMHPTRRRTDDKVYINKKYMQYEKEAGLDIKHRLARGKNIDGKMKLLEDIII